jgi:hypothetical protein
VIRLSSLALLLVVSTCGCAQRTDEGEIAASAVSEEKRECYRQSNEASLDTLQTLGQKELDAMLSAEAIQYTIAIRRRHEETCLKEAACLRIPGAQQGWYFEDCLRRHENDE